MTGIILVKTFLSNRFPSKQGTWMTCLRLSELLKVPPAPDHQQSCAFEVARLEGSPGRCVADADLRRAAAQCFETAVVERSAAPALQPPKKHSAPKRSAAVQLDQP